MADHLKIDRVNPYWLLVQTRPHKLIPKGDGALMAFLALVALLAAPPFLPGNR